MSFWNFLCQVAVLDMICNLFSPKRKRTLPSFPPSCGDARNALYLERVEELNREIREVERRSVVSGKISGSGISQKALYDDIDCLQDRIDELEDRLSECDMMSDRYDRLQDEIDVLQDRLDELEDYEDMPDVFDALSHHSHVTLHDMYHDEDYDW